MFKRLRWMSFGALVGIAGYRRASRLAREAVPQRRDLVRIAGAGLAEIKARFGSTVREGRSAMVAREAELRREYAGGNGRHR